MCDLKIEPLNQAPLFGWSNGLACKILQLGLPAPTQTLISDTLVGKDLHILPIQI